MKRWFLKAVAASLPACMMLSFSACDGRDKKSGEESYIEQYEVSDVLVNKGEYTPDQESTLEFYPEARKVVGDYGRFKKFVGKCEKGESVNIVFIGGSVTKGESASIKGKSYPVVVKNWMAERFPKAKINLYQQGINGTGSVIGADRADRDVISKNPDLVVVEFSVNDEDNDLDKEAYESLMRKILSAETQPAVIHLAHCNSKGGSTESMHAEICEYYNIPLISMQAAYEKGLLQKSWYTDIAHPTDDGFQQLANLITLTIADVQANLDEIGNIVTGLPKPITNNGFMDIKSMDMKDLNITDWGDWVKDGNNIACTKAGGDPIVIEINCSYLMAKYERSDKMDAVVKVVTDDDEENAITIKNHGLYYNVVTELCKIKEPAKHTVKIYMTKGDKFTMSTAYLANFVKNGQ